MTALRWLFVASLFVGGASSCRTDGVLFLTKTGVAVDADSQPPSVDIGYLRQEGVIARVYDESDDIGGKGTETAQVSRPLVHPVLTTVGTEAGGVGMNAKHSFATGPAALVFADALLDEGEYGLGEAGKVPHPRMDGTLLVSRDKGSVPYFFGTDTVLGLGVAWSGNAPRSVSIGYRRKELAVVPLRGSVVWHAPEWSSEARDVLIPDELLQAWIAGGFLVDTTDKSKFEPRDPGGDTPSPTERTIQQLIDTNRLVPYDATRLPSLIATAQAGAAAKRDAASTGIKVGQTFATGAAATLLAKHGEIRAVLGPALIANYEEALQLRRVKSEGLALYAFVIGALSEEDRAVIMALPSSYLTECAFEEFTYVERVAGLEPAAVLKEAVPAGVDDILGVVAYLGTLARSLKSLNELDESGLFEPGTPLQVLNDDDAAVPITAEDLELLKDQLAHQREAHAALVTCLESNEDFQVAMRKVRELAGGLFGRVEEGE